MPRISVLLPVYNAERFVAAAMDSILSQTFADFELLVIDDGSQDRTAEILDRYRDPRIVRVEHGENRGITFSLNEGLRLAEGEFIARQDADDLSFPTRLEEELELLSREPQTVIVGTNCEQIDKVGNYMKTWRFPEDDTPLRWRSLFECSFIHTSVMLRADTLRCHHLSYDPAAVDAEDYELWSRLLKYGRGRNLGKPLVQRRTHADQIGARSKQQRITCDRISVSNLRQIGIDSDVSDEELVALRRWKIESPTLESQEDISRARLLLRVIEAFSRQPEIDSLEARKLRRIWVKRILDLVRAKDASTVFRSGLFGDVLRRDTMSGLAYASARGLRRVGRSFGIER